MKLIRKNIFKITFFVVLFVICSVFAIKTLLKSNEVYAKEDEILLNNNVVEKEEKENKNIQEFYVDIKGEVLNPGVYKVEEGLRVIDVINSAGGLLETSDTSNINLSKKVRDEMVIIIKSKEEEKNIKFNSIKNDALILEKDLVTISSNNVSISDALEDNEEQKELNTMVSLNTSTKEELLTLSGIGESKADAIIKYREEHGPFNTIEEVMNVSGIGESLYEKIKNNITT